MPPVEVQIDAMSNVRSRLVAMRDSVKKGEFEDLGGPMNEFGHFDRSGMLQHHHALAHESMTETLEAVARSIDVFSAALVAAQDAFDNEDQNVRVQMRAYGNAVSTLNESSYLPGTDEARNRCRHEHKG